MGGGRSKLAPATPLHEQHFNMLRSLESTGIFLQKEAETGEIKEYPIERL